MNRPHNRKRPTIIEYQKVQSALSNLITAIGEDRQSRLRNFVMTDKAIEEAQEVLWGRNKKEQVK